MGGPQGVVASRIARPSRSWPGVVIAVGLGEVGELVSSTASSNGTVELQYRRPTNPAAASP